MTIPSIESLYATIEQQQRVIKQAHEDIAGLKSSLDNAGMIIERLTHERDNLLDAQAKSLQTIGKLTAERDRFANMISESSNRWQEMMYALREAKEALVMNIVGTGGRTPATHNAIATIKKVLGEE